MHGPRGESGHPDEARPSAELPEQNTAADLAWPAAGGDVVGEHLDRTDAAGAGSGNESHSESVTPHTASDTEVLGTGEGRAEEVGELDPISGNSLETGRADPEGAGVAGGDAAGDPQREVDRVPDELDAEISDGLTILNGPREIAALLAKEQAAKETWRAAASMGKDDRPEDETESGEHKAWAAAQQARERAQQQYDAAVAREQQRAVDVELAAMADGAMPDDVTREEDIHPNDGLPVDLQPEVRAKIAADIAAIPNRLLVHRDNKDTISDAEAEEASRQFMQSLQRAGAALGGNKAYEIFETYTRVQERNKDLGITGRDDLFNDADLQGLEVVSSDINTPHSFMQRDVGYENRLEDRGIDYLITRQEAAYAKEVNQDNPNGSKLNQLSRVIAGLSHIRINMKQEPIAPVPWDAPLPDETMIVAAMQYDEAIRDDLLRAVGLANNPEFYGSMSLQDKPLKTMGAELRTLIAGLKVFENCDTLDAATNELVGRVEALSSNERMVSDMGTDTKEIHHLLKFYKKLLILWPNITILHESGVKTPLGAEFYYTAKKRKQEITSQNSGRGLTQPPRPRLSDPWGKPE